MRLEQFSAYLADVAPGRDHCARAAELEASFGFNLDNADLSPQGIAALMRRLVSPSPEGAAALAAYGEFLTFYKAR